MKILIVEDERPAMDAMILLIHKLFPDFDTIMEAENGEKAVTMAKAEIPDLILMDINLPLLDRISAASEILKTNKNITIIMVSAYSDYDHLRNSIRNQVFDYLIKPFSADSFKEAIDRAIQSRNYCPCVCGTAATIHKVKSFIEKHYAENITLRDIAKAVSLDKSYLGRVFRKECDMTVMDYLRSTRITNAKKLLLMGYSSAEVAEKAGFGDSSYFSRTFHEETGLTPSAYRQKYL